MKRWPGARRVAMECSLARTELAELVTGAHGHAWPVLIDLPPSLAASENARGLIWQSHSAARPDL